MTKDGCDYLVSLQTTIGEMQGANVSKPSCEGTKNSSCGSVSVGFPITMMITGMGLMLRMISTQVSSHMCNSTATTSNHTSSQDVHLDCNFFLTAIRLASLNQILDPWVYLLFREILLRKFCIVANAVSNCSIEDQKEPQAALDALNKQNHDGNNLKPQSS
ncbi:prostaglandin E2 receptor EP3 subtype isoform X2 [Dicentrarchus labrax]|uniref:prostaglandin E2 receptor EP3 subtype isoform X2 n=1 Tax=Dicentrarchus labrax TaxID=13489 RepID=UPI0021F54BD8|nr:prostaglandin E2 receptor EP3 subtype isoform X2 [Dicentrarchus labrax]